MEYLMGIDLGSTSIKAVVYDEKGKPMASGSTPTEVSHLNNEHPEWVFWDPDIIWQSVSRSVKAALSNLGKQSIAAVTVTGWGMDGLPIDKAGNPLYPFISWHCTRTEPQRERFEKEVGPDRIFKVSGTQMLTIHTAYRMMWIMDNYPDILPRAETWLPIEDFVNYKLCGARGTDYSMASCTALFDQKKREWSDELIERSGIPRHIFPEVRDSGTKIGTVSKEASLQCGLKEGTPVVLGGHDYHCAALAVGAIERGIVMDITGTWEILFAACREVNLDQSVFLSGLILEGHVARSMYNYAAYALSAGMLEWYKDEFAVEERLSAEEAGTAVWDVLMDEAAAVPPGSHGVFFLPHFSGAVIPQVDTKSLGAFVGLSERAKREVCARAVIEGLDYQFRQLLESFESAMGKSIDKVIAVGGTTRNKFWMQNKADVSGRTVEVPDIEEATPLGAAILAGIGVGIYNNEHDAYRNTHRPGKTYTPNADMAAHYETYYQIYKQIYPNLKNVSRSIFDMFLKD
jgi:xylulokinase